MLVKAVKCKHCGDIIYSRSTFDFQQCTCGKCKVEGGIYKFVVTGEKKDMLIIKNFFVNCTYYDMLNDYTSLDKKYGHIKGDGKSE